MKQEPQQKVMNKKGLATFIMIAIGFGVAVVGLVIIAVLLQSILTTTSSGNGMCTNTTHIFNLTTGTCNVATNVSQTSPGSFAGNVTVQGLVFSQNFSNQWGLAGTILGYTLVLAILALIGVGGFLGYQKLRGNR